MILLFDNLIEGRSLGAREDGGGGGEGKVEEQVGQFCIRPNHFSPLLPLLTLRVFCKLI